MKLSKLKSGYTTGTHTVAIVKALLIAKFKKRRVKSVKLKLPNKKYANIKINFFSKNRAFSIKGDNDDLDVTKGAKIEVYLVNRVNKNLLNPTKHSPTIIKIGSNKIFLYAGKGVGVVTKKGLKIDVGYPAINPTPLKMIENEAKRILKTKNQNLYFIVSIKNGEKIAQNTANAKVGVIGGLSILGTTGIVKPVSASAYLDSVEAEISVANSNCTQVIFTLGNSAYRFAQKESLEVCIVEIGNFIYDSFQKLKYTNLKEVTFITSLGKMTKVAQGFKNTHNRFGDIDFDLIKLWIKDEFQIELNSEFATTKAISDELVKIDESLKEKFFIMVTKKASEVLSSWSEDINLKVVCLDGKKVYKVEKSF